MSKKKNAEVGKPTRTSPAGFVWEGRDCRECSNPCRITFGDVFPVDILVAQNPNGESWEFGVEWRTKEVERTNDDDLVVGQYALSRGMLFVEAVSYVGNALGESWRQIGTTISYGLNMLKPLAPDQVHDLSGLEFLNQPTQAEAKPERTIMRQERLETFAKAFTEWERRFRTDPERFQSEAAKLLKSTPKTYGDACAPYFLKLLKEVAK